MIINPIIPIWAMAIISLALLFPFRKGIVNYIIQFIIVLLLFVINLRPMVPNGENSEMTRDYKVLFVVDNTISMFAEDMEDNQSRMSRVKEDCKYIMDNLSGASFSAVRFDNEVRQMVPFSYDQELTLQSISTLLGQSSIYATGSTLNIIKEPLINILKGMKDDCVIVFIISDGEDTMDEELSSFSELSGYIDGGAVLGYGSKEGGRMKALTYLDSDGKAEYLYYYDNDFNMKEAVSRIDEERLKSLSKDLGVDYVHMEKTKNIDKVLSKVKLTISDIKLEKGKLKLGYNDIYYYFAGLLCIVLIIDFILYRRKVLKL